MSNSIQDLNNHLFAQMNRLSDANMSPEDLEKEVKRATAMVSVADQISHNADLQLKAAKLYADHGAKILDHLPQIGKAAE